MQYGKLKVIEVVSKVMNNIELSRVAKCECECGALVETHFNQLQQGLTISCGCTPLEAGEMGQPLTLAELVEIMKDKNILELSAKVGITHITLYKITKEFEETGTTTVRQTTLEILSDHFKKEAIKHLNLSKR